VNRTGELTKRHAHRQDSSRGRIQGSGCGSGYANVQVETKAAKAQLVVPSSAIQSVGDRTVAYLKDPRTRGENHCACRPPWYDVRRPGLGAVALTEGEIVVSQGSFFMRAERDRLGLRATQ
jgi:hypothetical protein